MPLMNSEHKQTLGFLIHTAGRLMRKSFEQRTVSLGLDMSSSQWRLLFWVAKEEGVTQARLAELLEIEPISVSRLVDRMVQNGWIERRSDATDRRVRTIFSTKKGRDAYDELMAVAHRVSDEALAGLPQETRRALVKGLEALVDNLSCGEMANPPDERAGASRREGGAKIDTLESAVS
jgi:DNA-binding MarR family transcriptional regulator